MIQLIVIIFLLIASPVFAGTNLIQNSSFEVSAGDTWFWNGNQLYTPLENFESAAYEGVSTGDAKTGTHSLKIFCGSTNTTPKRNQYVNSKIYVLKPNTTYTASAYVKCSRASEIKFNLQVMNADSSGGLNSGVSLFVGSGTGWTRIKNEFTTPDNAYLGYIIQLYPNASSVNEYFYVDDVQLEECAEGALPAYSPSEYIELGWSSANNGNVFVSTDANYNMNLNAYNGDSSERTATIVYEVYNWQMDKVASGTSAVTLVSGATSTATVDMKTSLGSEVGWFTIISWIDGYINSQRETNFSVVYPARFSGTTDFANYIMGAHIPYVSYDGGTNSYWMSIAQKMGIKWNRSLSTGLQIASWEQVEATNDGETYNDSDLQLAKGTYLIETLAVLGAIYTDIPTWASSTVTVTGNADDDYFDISDVSKIEAGDLIILFKPNTAVKHANDGVYLVDSVVGTKVYVDTGTKSVVTSGVSTGVLMFVIDPGDADTDTWQDFVTDIVTHYYNLANGSIRFWEIWNEPHLSIQTGMNSDGTGESNSDYAYADLLSQTRAFITAVDSGATIVMAGCSKDGSYQTYFDNVFSRVGAPVTDTMHFTAVHSYPNALDKTYSDDFLGRLQTNSVSAWQTEVGNKGWPAHLSQAHEYNDMDFAYPNQYYPYHRVGALLQNFFMWMRQSADGSQAVKKYFYYDMRGVSGYDAYKTSFSMFNADGTLKQNGVAYSVIGYFFDNPQQFGKMITGGNIPATVYVVSWKDTAGDPWMVMWTSDTTWKSATFTGHAAALFTWYDSMGNSKAISGGANAVINVNERPTYLKATGQAIADLEAWVAAATWANYTDSTPPGLRIVSAPRGSLVNGQQYYFKFLATDDDSWDSESAVQYSYKLVGGGLNEEYCAWTTVPYVTKTATASSSYTFSVQAKDAAGNTSEIIITDGDTDTTAPSITDPLPTEPGSCTTNPRNITLQVTTNELATCRWSEDTAGGDEAYADLDNEFDTTGGTSHSDTLSVACGTTDKTVYVRCTDQAGNINSSSQTIVFSINAEETDPGTGSIGTGTGSIKSVSPSTPGVGTFKVQ